MNKLYQAHALLFTVGVLYAINYLVAKDVMPKYIGASGFIFYRVFGATLLFWITGVFTKKESIKREDLPRFILAALFGIAGNQLMFFNGLSLTSPVNASVIMTSNPVLVLVASALILKEAITPTRLAGIGLGIIGAIGLILTPILLGYTEVDWKEGNPIGDALILGNALSYGVYLVIVKPLMAKYDAMTVIKWVFTFGCFMVFPFGYNQALEVDWPNMPTNIVWSFLYVVIGVTYLVYFFNVYAMKTVSPSVVSAYIYLQPVLAGTLSILLGYEELHWIKVTAAAFIFSGVYLVSFRKKKA